MYTAIIIIIIIIIKVIIIIIIIIIIMIKVSSSVASLALTGSRLAIGFNCGAVEVLIPHNDYDDHDVMVSLGNH